MWCYTFVTPLENNLYRTRLTENKNWRKIIFIVILRNLGFVTGKITVPVWFVKNETIVCGTLVKAARSDHIMKTSLTDTLRCASTEVNIWERAINK